jgi:acyl-CoA synthetase (AMP-forming)/AMP-acid ligase II/thioesterase domain-containing protein/acyl carrier protein
MDAASTSVLRIAPGDTQLSILGLERGTERTFSYDELFAAAEERATGLAEHGIGHGDVVALCAHATFDFLVGCFAAWRRGAVVVTLPPPPPLGSRSAWAQHVNAVLETSSAKALLRSDGDPPLETDVRFIDSTALGNGGPLADAGPEPSDIALIQFTSGSTAAPKGIVLEHRAVVACADAVRRRYGPFPGDDSILFSWLPLHHDYGFIVYMIRALSGGWPAVLMPTQTFIAEPLRWLEEMSRTRATDSAASNSAYGFVARELEKYSGRPFDLSHWRMAGCGGEPVDPTTMGRFATAAADHGFDPRALAPGWGLAEATCTVTGQALLCGCPVDRVDRQALGRGEATPARSDVGVVEIAGAGPPLDGYEVLITDEHGGLLPERRVGEVVVRSPALMRGYLGDPDATNAVLEDGSLRTGDLGYLADGHLFITGRLKDVIIVDGANYHATDIERIVETVPGVRKGGCVAIPTHKGGSEKLGVIAEAGIAPDEVDAEKHAIRSAVLAETGISPAVVTLVAPRSLPKTTSGKLMRAEARDMLATGALIDLAPPSRASSTEPLTETEGRIADIWKQILGLPRVERGDDFFELGGTSLQAVRVVTEIESRLHVDLPLSVLALRPILGELSASVDEAGGSISRTLIPLARSEAGADLFAIPGAGGTVYGFRTLALELADRCSFYAFEARGADGRSRPDRSVEEMAERYITEMKRVSDGPYILLGYSFGGVVAYEIASRLFAEGTAPVRVILLDSAVPSTIQPAGFRPGRQRGIANLRNRARHLVVMTIVRFLAWGRRNLRTPISPRLYLRYLLGSANSLSDRYVPPSYLGPVDYVQVVAGDVAPTEKHMRAWRSVASDLRVHPVDVPSHQHLLFEPWVKELAPVLAGLLNASPEDRSDRAAT